MIKSRLHDMRALLSNLSRLTMQGGLQSHSAVNEETLASDIVRRSTHSCCFRSPATPRRNPILLVCLGCVT